MENLDQRNFENNEVLNTLIPPNDFQAEQAVLGSMIFDEEGISIIQEILTGQDFYRPNHKAIFEAIIDMHSFNEPVDIVTLTNKLKNIKILDQIGGIDYIVNLSGLVFTSSKSATYANIVKEKSLRRRIIKIANSISEEGYSYDKDVDSILTDFRNKIDKIETNGSEDIVHISKALEESLTEIEKLYRKKGNVSGISTGFKDFDLKTSGLQQSDLILIAARPSMGKTAFALNIAQNCAINNNVSVAIFSLEMSKIQLVNRMLCSESKISSQDLRIGNIKDEDWGKIADGLHILSEAPIYIYDKSNITINELLSKCRKLQKEKGLDLIIIDYLQLMTAGGRHESRQQEISNISRSLKGLARELNIPVVALSQLSRAVEQRKPARPMLSDLRESGAIEQDADVVCFLYRDEYYNPETTEKKNIAEVIIAKQRNGSVGSIDLTWIGKYTLFQNCERQFSEASEKNSPF